MAKYGLHPSSQVRQELLPANESQTFALIAEESHAVGLDLSAFAGRPLWQRSYVLKEQTPHSSFGTREIDALFLFSGGHVVGACLDVGGYYPPFAPLSDVATYTR